MKSKLMYILIPLFACFAASVQAADKGGNGGDICEDRFKIVRDDISSWIKQGGASSLTLPAAITSEQYSATMLDQLSKAKVSCSTDTILIGESEKTCKNLVDQQGKALIICNSNRFMQTKESDQYVLVHHEYAGLAGLEVNTDEDSHYDISNQITENLTNEVVKKLAVRPTPHSGSTRYTRLYKNPDGSFSIYEPKFALPSEQILNISDYSDLDGVCKLFGFSAVYSLADRPEYSVTYDSGSKVILDSDGVLKGIQDEDQNFDKDTIYLITCEGTVPARGPMLKLPVAATLNDDGVTVSVADPRILFGVGEYGVLDSDLGTLDYLCKMVGDATGRPLTKAIPSTTRYYDTPPNTLCFLTSDGDPRDGKDNYFCSDKGSNYSDQHTYYGEVSSLICK